MSWAWFGPPPALAQATAAGSAATLGLVKATFFPNPRNGGRFDVTQLQRPAFSSMFPVIAFNPPARLQEGCARRAGVDEFTRPYTDLVPLRGGRCATKVAEGNGKRAGVGALRSFEAAFTTTVAVTQAGEVTFDVYADDGWILAIGPHGGLQPRRLAGPQEGRQRAGIITGYPRLGAHEAASSPRRDTTVVSFPGPGEYPLEVDYTECCGGQDSLRIATMFEAHTTPQPTVTVVSPDHGPASGDTPVAVRGTGFSTVPGATTFRFGATGRLATRAWCTTAYECSAVSPPGTGRTDVFATVAGVTSPRSTGDSFTFEAPPELGEFIDIPPRVQVPEDSPLRLSTDTPQEWVDLPIGFELVPDAMFRARWRHGQPRPPAAALRVGRNPEAGLHLLSWASRSLVEDEAHLFDRLAFSLDAGPLEKPEHEDNGSEMAYAFPIVRGAIDLPPTPVATPVGNVEAELTVGVTLSVQLYTEQAIDYIAEKLVEGAAAGLSEVLSGGGDSPLVAAALAIERTAQLAEEVERYKGVLSLIQKRWGALHPPQLSIADVVRQVVGLSTPELLKRLRVLLKEKLAAAIEWVGERATEQVAKIFEAGRWVTGLGAPAVRLTGAPILERGRRVPGARLGPSSRASPGRFEARKPYMLALSRLRDLRGLGFGKRLLSEEEAVREARALVKYEPAAVTVRPLLVSDLKPKPGAVLCVAGGALTNAPTAVLELSGPGYRAYALVRTKSGVAGGCFTLPGSMASGTWTVGVVDYHAAERPAGVLLDAFSFARAETSRSRGSSVWLGLGVGIGVAVLALSGLALPIRRRHPALASIRAAASTANAADLVIVALVIAVPAWFAGTAATIAVGHDPPPALWAAGGGLLGALLGRAIAPAARTSQRPGPAAAHAAVTDSHPVAYGRARRRVTLGLLIAFVIFLGLAIALAAGAVTPTPTFVDPLRAISTALLTLGAASGAALLSGLATQAGDLAP